MSLKTISIKKRLKQYYCRKVVKKVKIKLKLIKGFTKGIILSIEIKKSELHLVTVEKSEPLVTRKLLLPKTIKYKG